MAGPAYGHVIVLFWGSTRCRYSEIHCPYTVMNPKLGGWSSWLRGLELNSRRSCPTIAMLRTVPYTMYSTAPSPTASWERPSQLFPSRPHPLELYRASCGSESSGGEI